MGEGGRNTLNLVKYYIQLELLHKILYPIRTLFRKHKF